MSRLQSTNPFVDMYQSQLEVSRQFAGAIFAGTGKIDHVLLDAARHALKEQLKFAQSLASAPDVRNLKEMQESLLFRPQENMNYQREVWQVFADMQNDIGKMLQSYIEQTGRKLASNARQLTEAVPAAPGEAANPLAGIYSMWESALKGVAALSNKNTTTARSTVEEAANAATKTAAPAGQAALNRNGRDAGDITKARKQSR